MKTHGKVMVTGMLAARKRPVPFKRARRVLIIKPSALGDVVHALPLLDAIRRNMPAAKIGWIISGACADIIRHDPRVDEAIVFERERWRNLRSLLSNMGELVTFIERVEFARYDMVIDLQGLLRSGLMAYASAARVRLGLSDAREKSQVFYNALVEVGRRPLHAVDRYLKIADALEMEHEAAAFHLHVDDEARANVQELLARRGFDDGAPLVVIAPSARWRTKIWAAERFAAVAAGLADDGARVVIVGSKAEKERARRVELRLEDAERERTVNLAGRTSLGELVALIERAALLITNDSGPMHIADALGTPLVAVFGPTDPARTGPYRQRDGVIRSDACGAPCLKRRCEDVRCLDAIDAGTVLDKARARMAAGRGVVRDVPTSVGEAARW